MKQKLLFLFFCMIFVAKLAFCQKNGYFNKLQFPAIRLNGQSFYPSLKSSGNLQIIPASYYTSQLGFFCRKEIQFENATRIPLRFRLGSVQYCNWMEGKKYAGFLPGN